MEGNNFETMVLEKLRQTEERKRKAKEMTDNLDVCVKYDNEKT